ncbi:MAG: RNA polymerase sigma factor, partial [Lachnospiraceae bacterium]
MDDQTIIEMYWQRNEQAITETDTKYGGRLHLLAQQILNNHEDSEECVNDTYHAAWQSIPPKKPLYFFAYLAKITRNLALDLLDYRSAQKRSVLIVTLSKELEQCLPAPNDFEK